MENLINLVDPVFLRKTKYSYVNYNDAELSSVLCFALSKNNADLILHQQRIEFYKETKQTNLLYSALIDLFTALGSKGTEYKQRMLDKYGSILSTRQTMTLTRALVSKLTPSKVFDNLDQSILNYGNQGEVLSISHLEDLR